jgi:hypothetical protein
MKQNINEVKRMQQLAGILKENQNIGIDLNKISDYKVSYDREGAPEFTDAYLYDIEYDGRPATPEEEEEINNNYEYVLKAVQNSMK